MWCAGAHTKIIRKMSALKYCPEVKTHESHCKAPAAVKSPAFCLGCLLSMVQRNWKRTGSVILYQDSPGKVTRGPEDQELKVILS